jgi:hypothetical protein
MKFWFLFATVCLISCSMEAGGDTDALSAWFAENGVATAYTVDSLEVELAPARSFAPGFNPTPYRLSSQGTLGDTLGVSHALVFDMAHPDTALLLRADSAYYASYFDAAALPARQGVLSFAYRPDTASAWSDEGEASISLKDSLWVRFPEALQGKLRALSPDSLGVWGAQVRVSASTFMRVSLSRLDTTVRNVLQADSVVDPCASCLHAGIRETLALAFDAQPLLDSLKAKTRGIPLLAQMQIPRLTTGANSEIDTVHLPLYVVSLLDSVGAGGFRPYGEGFVSDTSSANRDGDLVQVTQMMRWTFDTYDLNKPDSLRFVFRFGSPGEGYLLGRYDFSKVLTPSIRFKIFTATP